MVDYRIESSQLKLLSSLVSSIEQNYEVKNEIFKILWTVLDQKINVPSECGDSAPEPRHDVAANL
jgi:SMC interacting uncharacterized protein involved in chromosome segregation